MGRQISPFVLRSTSQCFGELVPPKTPEQAFERLVKNGDYFKANYLLALAAILVVVCFLRPIVFVILALTIGSIWYFLFVNIMPVVILGRALSRREIFYWCSGLGYLGLCLFGGRTVWYSIGLWLILCLAHALLRKETIGAKFNSVVNRVSKPSRFEEALFGFLEEMFDIQDDSGPGVGARRIDHSFSRSHGSRALSAEADAVYVDPEDPQMQEYAAYRQNADENRSRRREIISQLQAKYGTHT